MSTLDQTHVIVVTSLSINDYHAIIKIVSTQYGSEYVSIIQEYLCVMCVSFRKVFQTRYFTRTRIPLVQVIPRTRDSA